MSIVMRALDSAGCRISLFTLACLKEYFDAAGEEVGIFSHGVSEETPAHGQFSKFATSML